MEVHELIDQLSKNKNKDLDLKTVISIYLDYIRSNKRYGTYDHDEGHLRMITDFLFEHGVQDTRDINMELIYKFNRFQKEKGLANRTINKRLLVLKRAINKSIELGYINSNPLENVSKLKEVDKEIAIIPEYVYEKIFNYLNEQTNKYYIRDKTIYYLFLETGIRISELIALNYEDINFEEKFLHLKITKTNQERILYLSSYVFYQLNVYIKLFNINTGPLFRTIHNKRITKNTINCRLRDIKKDLKISISISPHKWRHTCATLSLQNGAHVEEVQKLLGHKDLATTNRYVHVRSESVKEMVKLSSPVKKMLTKF